MTPPMPLPVRALLVGLLLALPSGCAAVRSLNASATALDVYELVPVADAAGGARTSRSLAVDPPAAPAAIATDRILVKPDPLTVAYLGEARWVEPAPAHVQSLLARSLAASGRTGFVTTATTGPLPDYHLIASIEDFQAEVTEGAAAPVNVVVSIELTVARDIDARTVASRRFRSRIAAASDSAPDIAIAFNQATSAILREATGWTISAMSTGGV